MDNFDINLDLLKFKNSALLDLQRNGTPVKCIVIPIEENSLFVGKDGKSVYANFRAMAMQSQNKYGNTHYVKLSLSKEAYKALSDDEKKNQPFYGSMKPSGSYGNNGDNNGGSRYQKQSSRQQEKVSEYSNINADNLPF
ncbi:MAG: hypothetical protein ACI4TK_04585, partial [Agathobacter sp.]